MSVKSVYADLLEAGDTIKEATTILMSWVDEDELDPEVAFEVNGLLATLPDLRDLRRRLLELRKRGDQ